MAKVVAGGGGSKNICPGLTFKLTAEGRVQMVPDGGTTQAAVDYCLAIPAHATAKLFECSTGGKTTDEQRFVWKADAAGHGTLALAPGQFRSLQCLGLIAPKDLAIGALSAAALLTACLWFDLFSDRLGCL